MWQVHGPRYATRGCSRYPPILGMQGVSGVRWDPPFCISLYASGESRSWADIVRRSEGLAESREMFGYRRIDLNSAQVFRQLAEPRQRSAVGVESASLLAVGMEVQEQMNSLVDRDLGDIGRRDQKELVRELPLFRHPRQ